LINDLHRKFPALTGIGIDYSWWGWVDVSHDMMPRIVQPDPKQSIFYSLGYGGNGVMYSAQAGRRMAERIAGKATRHGLADLQFETAVSQHDGTGRVASVRPRSAAWASASCTAVSLEG